MAVGAAASAGACGGGQTVPPPVPEARVVVPPPPASASAEVEVPPEPVAARANLPELHAWPWPDEIHTPSNKAQKACLAALAAAGKDAERATGEYELGESRALQGCFAGTKGAWGLLTFVREYERLPMGPGWWTSNCVDEGQCPVRPVYEGHVVFFPENGKKMAGGYIESAGGVSEGQVVVFDFDGDGAEELLVVSDASEIFTFRDGKVAPYGGTSKPRFVMAVKEDEDAIPDLLLPNPYLPPADATLACPRRGGAPLMGPSVEIQAIAHGLPGGGFSTTDSVATARARVICPARPKKLVPKDAAGHIQQQEMWEAIACARLWGVDADGVKAALDKDCGALPADHDVCGAAYDVTVEHRGLPYCVAREWTDEWVTAAPPLQLR